MIPLTEGFVGFTRLVITLVGGGLVLLVVVGLSFELNEIRQKGIPVAGSIARLTSRTSIVVLTVACVLLALLRLLSFALTAASTPVLRVVLGTPIIILMSGLLFWLKIKRLGHYAMIEGTFALAVCVQTLSGLGDYISPAQVAGLLTSAYLFIRAADNFKKHREEEKKRWAEAFAESRKSPGTYVPVIVDHTGQFNPPWWRRVIRLFVE